MKLYNRKRLLQAILLCTGFSITACGGGGGSGSSPSMSGEMAPTTLEHPVRLGNIGVLPASDTNGASYALELSNYSKNKYIVESIKILGLGKGSTDTLLEADSNLCKELSANGSCTIRLTPHTLKSTDVGLEVMLKDGSGKVSRVYQMIRISSLLDSSKGGIVMENDIHKIVTEDGNYSLSIPVVLGETYDDIKATNGSLLCNTEGYLKGASCTYLVKGKTGDGGAIISTNLQGYRGGKVVSSVGGSTLVDVGKGINILLSNGVTMYHPESSNTVRVYNSGNVAAKLENPSVTGGGIEVNGSYTGVGCDGGILAPSSSCDVNLSVPATTLTNGMASLEIAYSSNDEASAKETGSTLTNVYYSVAKASAGLSINTTDGTRLNGTIVGGVTRTIDFTLENTQNRTLTNHIYLAPSPGTEFNLAPGASGGCVLKGGTLAAGASCTVRVSYTPTAATAGQQTVNLVVNSTYNDSFEHTQSMINSFGIKYSADVPGDTAPALAWRTADDGSGDLSIMHDGVENKSEEWVLSNTLALEEGLSATIGSAGITLSSAVDGLSVVAVSSGTCGTGHVIAGGSSCRYRVTYGPTSVASAATSVHLLAPYSVNGTTDTASSKNFTVQTTNVPDADIGLVIADNGVASLTGNGTSISPYSFTALSDNKLVLTYTYTNNGSLPAYNVNFNTGALDKGEVVDGDCPTGHQARTLQSGDSCTLMISIPHGSLLDAPSLRSDPVVGPFVIEIPYTYSSQLGGGGVRKVRVEDEMKRNVQFTRLWGALTAGEPVVTETGDSHKFTITPEVAVGASDLNVTYPIKVSVTVDHSINGVTLPNCEINEGETSCELEVNLPKTLFVNSSKLHTTLVAKVSSDN